MRISSCSPKLHKKPKVQPKAVCIESALNRVATVSRIASLSLALRTLLLHYETLVECEEDQSWKLITLHNLVILLYHTNPFTFFPKSISLSTNACVQLSIRGCSYCNLYLRQWCKCEIHSPTEQKIPIVAKCSFKDENRNKVQEALICAKYGYIYFHAIYIHNVKSRCPQCQGSIWPIWRLKAILS